MATARPAPAAPSISPAPLSRSGLTLRKRALRLLPGLAALLALTGCSSVFADHVQPLVRGRGAEPAAEAIRVEGFVLTTEHVDSTLVTSTAAATLGYDQWFYGEAHGGETVTRVMRPRKDHTLREMAERLAEDSRVATYVNVQGRSPDFVLRGRFDDGESYGLIWTLPLNTVLSCGLVLPWTWAETYTATVRVYAGDGRFLREYRASADARSWHSWSATIRARAVEERMVAACAAAAARAMDDVLRDMLEGRLQQ